MPCGTRNHSQCAQTSTFSSARMRAGRASARWRRSVGQLAEAERAVDADRVVDAHAALERLGVVVGHLVRRDVGPHVQARPSRRLARGCAATATHRATGAA